MSIPRSLSIAACLLPLLAFAAGSGGGAPAADTAAAMGGASARDTLRLGLAQAESLFAARSAALLAKRFEVDADRASAQQARLWDNPNLAVTQGFYDWRTRRFFELDGKGETALTVQQLLATAGKRSKRVALEAAKARLTELEYAALLRDLRHGLRSDFFALHFLRRRLEVYDLEIASARELVDGFSGQYQKGNISLVEYSRLRSLLFELEDERRELSDDMRDRQESLAALLAYPPGTVLVPAVDSSAWDRLSPASRPPAEVAAAAREARDEVRRARGEVEAGRADVAYQKALRLPDVTVGGTWDRSGGYIADYNALTLSADLPLWNRNQGGVRSAESRLKAAELRAAQAEREAEGEAKRAYAALAEADSLYRTWQKPFTDDFDNLAQGMARSYRKKAIGLLEFVDFFQAYKESKDRLYKLQNGRLDAFENVNYAAGKDLFDVH